MSDFVQRAYIQSRTALNIKPVLIHQELIQIHGEKSYKYRTVAKWSALFKDGRKSLEDDPRCGRPITETTTTNIDRVQAIIEEDPRSTYDDIEALSGLCRGTIHLIIHDHLCMSKRASRWIPHYLSDQNKRQRLQFAKDMLAKLDSGQWRLDQIITGDESWFYHRKIGKKNSNATWVVDGQEPATVVRRDRFERKTMFCVFFKTTGPLLVTYVEKGKTIDNIFYVENCLEPLFAEVRKQRKISGLHGLKLLHDNARPHIHSNTINFIQSNGVTIIDHPPYSPDLAPSDYWLFDYIKHHLDTELNEQTLAASITKVLNEIPRDEYLKTFKKYKERLQFCIDAKGDYFENFMK